MQLLQAPSEKPWRVEGLASRVPNGWPAEGAISFEDVAVVYREGLPPAIHDINLAIKAGEHLGVCGRTGSGKTTLVSTLFRVVELAQGRILIDGVDIATLGLHDLRTRIAFVTQEPVLFTTTIRRCLDPEDRYPQEDVLHALELVGLRDLVEGFGLDAMLAERGSNFSAGEKQASKDKVFFMACNCL